jgi:hypothetical protein
MSQHAAQIVNAAKAIGKWVHIGRVNHPDRFDHFENSERIRSMAPASLATPTCERPSPVATTKGSS